MASIVERNGTFQITVSVGYDINGKHIRQTVSFTPPDGLTPKKREKAVQAFAVEFENKVRNGQVLEGSKTTLKEFVERWQAEYASQRLQPGTYERYNDEIRDKILPALGHLKLTDIKPHTVNAFYVSMTKNGVRKDGKKGGYSRGTISKTANVLSSILKTAVDWEVISRNPCDNVRIPQEDSSEKLKFFTPEQVGIFLDYIEKPYTIQTKGHSRVDDTGIAYQVRDYELTRTIPEQLRIMFNLAVYSGLRKGELLGLQWPDVDFERHTVNVNKAIGMVNGKETCKVPKTKTSRRVVSIPSFLSDRMLHLKESQAAYQKELGDAWKGNNWVFTQANGSLMSYYTPYAAFQDAIHRYNADKDESDWLPAIPFHGLRHTSATLLIAGNQDLRTVSHRMGHAQPSTTMNIYAHALHENDRVASDLLESMLKRK